MLRTIEQSVHFSASAQELYKMFVDAKLHAAFTGAPVKISAKAGSPFSAFDGMLSGRMLYSIPGQLLVQRWRSCNWKEYQLDSVLVLEFVQEGSRGRINLVHVNVPEQDYAGVTEGWKKYYWKPLRDYLKRKA